MEALRTHSSTTQLQQNVHIITVFKERGERYNMLVLHPSMNTDFLCHLQSPLKRYSIVNDFKVLNQL